MSSTNVSEAVSLTQHQPPVLPVLPLMPEAPLAPMEKTKKPKKDKNKEKKKEKKDKKEKTHTTKGDADVKMANDDAPQKKKKKNKDKDHDDQKDKVKKDKNKKKEKEKAKNNPKPKEKGQKRKTKASDDDVNPVAAKKSKLESKDDIKKSSQDEKKSDHSEADVAMTYQPTQGLPTGRGKQLPQHHLQHVATLICTDMVKKVMAVRPSRQELEEKQPWNNIMFVSDIQTFDHDPRVHVHDMHRETDKVISGRWDEPQAIASVDSLGSMTFLRHNNPVVMKGPFHGDAGRQQVLRHFWLNKIWNVTVATPCGTSSMQVDMLYDKPRDDYYLLMDDVNHAMVCPPYITNRQRESWEVDLELKDTPLHDPVSPMLFRAQTLDQVLQHFHPVLSEWVIHPSFDAWDRNIMALNIMNAVLFRIFWHVDNNDPSHIMARAGSVFNVNMRMSEPGSGSADTKLVDGADAGSIQFMTRQLAAIFKYFGSSWHQSQLFKWQDQCSSILNVDASFSSACFPQLDQLPLSPAFVESFDVMSASSSSSMSLESS